MNNEMIERRKIRLVEVRQREKEAALIRREKVKKKKQEFMKEVASHLRMEFEENKENHGCLLMEKYKKRLREIGKAHNLDGKENCGLRKEIPVATILATRQRYEKALSSVLHEQSLKKQAVLKQELIRKKISEMELDRKEHILSLPKPTTDVISKLKPLCVNVIRSDQSKAESFLNTRYHLGSSNWTCYPETMVEKVSDEDQIDAVAAAEEEKMREKIRLDSLERQVEERKEKAEIRHSCARRDVILGQQKGSLMEELKALEIEDRNRRCEALKKIPKKVFQPSYQKVNDAELRKMELEQAFENIYNVNLGDIAELNLQDRDDSAGYIVDVSEGSVSYGKMSKGDQLPTVDTKPSDVSISEKIPDLRVASDDNADVANYGRTIRIDKSATSSPLTNYSESKSHSLSSMDIESGSSDRVSNILRTTPSMRKSPLPTSLSLVPPVSAQVKTAESKGEDRRHDVQDYVKTRLSNLHKQQAAIQELNQHDNSNIQVDVFLPQIEEYPSPASQVTAISKSDATSPPFSQEDSLNITADRLKKTLSPEKMSSKRSLTSKVISSAMQDDSVKLPDKLSVHDDISTSPGMILLDNLPGRSSYAGDRHGSRENRGIPIDGVPSKTVAEFKKVREKKEELRRNYALLSDKIENYRKNMKEKEERFARRKAAKNLSKIDEESEEVDFQCEVDEKYQMSHSDVESFGLSSTSREGLPDTISESQSLIHSGFQHVSRSPYAGVRYPGNAMLDLLQPELDHRDGDISIERDPSELHGTSMPVYLSDKSALSSSAEKNGYDDVVSTAPSLADELIVLTKHGESTHQQSHMQSEVKQLSKIDLFGSVSDNQSYTSRYASSPEKSILHSSANSSSLQEQDLFSVQSVSPKSSSGKSPMYSLTNSSSLQEQQISFGQTLSPDIDSSSGKSPMYSSTNSSFLQEQHLSSAVNTIDISGATFRSFSCEKASAIRQPEKSKSMNSFVSLKCYTDSSQTLVDEGAVSAPSPLPNEPHNKITSPSEVSHSIGSSVGSGEEAKQVESAALPGIYLQSSKDAIDELHSNSSHLVSSSESSLVLKTGSVTSMQKDDTLDSVQLTSPRAPLTDPEESESMQSLPYNSLERKDHVQSPHNLSKFFEPPSEPPHSISKFDDLPSELLHGLSPLFKISSEASHLSSTFIDKSMESPQRISPSLSSESPLGLSPLVESFFELPHRISTLELPGESSKAISAFINVPPKSSHRASTLADVSAISPDQISRATPDATLKLCKTSSLVETSRESPFKLYSFVETLPKSPQMVSQSFDPPSKSPRASFVEVLLKSPGSMSQSHERSKESHSSVTQSIAEIPQIDSQKREEPISESPLNSTNEMISKSMYISDQAKLNSIPLMMERPSFHLSSPSSSLLRASAVISPSGESVRRASLGILSPQLPTEVSTETSGVSSSVKYKEKLKAINELSENYRAKQRRMVESFEKRKESLLSDTSRSSASFAEESLASSGLMDRLSLQSYKELQLPVNSKGIVKINGSFTESQASTLQIDGSQVSSNGSSLLEGMCFPHAKSELSIEPALGTDTLEMDENDQSHMSPRAGEHLSNVTQDAELNVASTRTFSDANANQRSKLFMSLFKGLSSPELIVPDSSGRDSEKFSIMSITEDSYKKLPAVPKHLDSLRESKSLPFMQNKSGVVSQSTIAESNRELEALMNLTSKSVGESENSVEGPATARERELLDRNNFLISYFHGTSPDLTVTENSGTDQIPISNLSLDSYQQLPAVKKYMESLMLEQNQTRHSDQVESLHASNEESLQMECTSKRRNQPLDHNVDFSSKDESQIEMKKLLMSYFEDNSPDISIPEKSVSGTEQFSALSITEDSYKNFPTMRRFLDSLRATKSMSASQRKLEELNESVAVKRKRITKQRSSLMMGNDQEYEKGAPSFPLSIGILPAGSPSNQHLSGDYGTSDLFYNDPHLQNPSNFQSTMSSDRTMSELVNLVSLSSDKLENHTSLANRGLISDVAQMGRRGSSKSGSDTSELFTVGRLRLTGYSNKISMTKEGGWETTESNNSSANSCGGNNRHMKAASSLSRVKLNKTARTRIEANKRGVHGEKKKQTNVSRKLKKQVKFE